MTAFVQPGRLEDLLDKFGNMSQGAVPRLPPSLVNSIRVTTTYLGYKKRKKLKAVGSRSAAQTFFNCQELGGKVSVADFFKRSTYIFGRSVNLLIQLTACRVQCPLASR